MKTVIERIVKAQDRLNIAMSLMHSKETRERNGLLNDRDRTMFSKDIISKLVDAKKAIEKAIIEVAKGETHG